MEDIAQKRFMFVVLRQILSQARVKNIESADTLDILLELGISPEGRVAIDYNVEQLKWGDDVITADDQRSALKLLKDESIISISGFVGGAMEDASYIEGEFENRNKYSIDSSFKKLQNKRDELYREIHGLPLIGGQVQVPVIEEKVADTESSIKKKSDIKHISSPIRELITPATRYEDICIRFIDDNDVEITVHDKTLRSDYEKMGFANQKDKNRPRTREWEFLIYLSHLEGALHWGNSLASPQVKQWKKRLSEELVSFFGISSDPFYKYNNKDGYKIRIKLIPDSESGFALSAHHFQARIISIEQKSEEECDIEDDKVDGVIDEKTKELDKIINIWQK